jgi:hypothetical protein
MASFSFNGLLDRVLPGGWRAAMEKVRAETEVAFRTREARDGWNVLTPPVDAAIPPWVDAAMELASARVMVLGGQLAAHIRPPSELPEYMELAIHFEAADAHWRIRQFEVASGRAALDHFEEGERAFRWELTRRLSVKLKALYLDAWLKYAGDLKAQVPVVGASHPASPSQPPSAGGVDNDPCGVAPTPDPGTDTPPPASLRGAGRQWSDVEIAFLNDTEVEIRIGDEQPYRMDYRELGFADGRDPSQSAPAVLAWRLLRGLADTSGSIPTPALRFDNRLPEKKNREKRLKAVERINDLFARHFPGIEGRSIRHSKGTGHQTRFKIGRHADFDDRRDEPSEIDRFDDEVAEIRKGLYVKPSNLYSDRR